MAKTPDEQIQDAEIDVKLREQDDAAAARDEETGLDPVDDIDAEELAAAAADLAKEQGGDDDEQEEGAEDPIPEPTEPKTPPAEQEAAAPDPDATEEEAPEEDAAGTTVPKGRLDQQIDKTRQAREAEQKALQEAAYYKGLAEGRASNPATSGDQPGAVPAAKTPEEQIAELRAQKQKNATEYEDGGDLTLADLTSRQDELDDKIFAIKAEQLRPAAPSEPAPATNTAANDLYLQQRTAQLTEEHPYTQEGVLGEEDWIFLQGKAVAALSEAGAPLPQGQLTPDQMLSLRTKIAELSDEFGPVLNKTFVPPKAKGQEPKPKPGLADVGATERAESLAAAQRQPPNTNGVGTPGVQITVTDADIENMSEDDIARLPLAERRRIMPE